MALRTPVFEIVSTPALRARVRAYLLHRAADGPYTEADAEQWREASLPGSGLTVLEEQLLVPGQVHRIRAEATWAVANLGIPLQVIGLVLRYEPLSHPDDWRVLGKLIFDAPRVLTPVQNRLRLRFTYQAMQRPVV